MLIFVTHNSDLRKMPSLDKTSIILCCLKIRDTEVNMRWIPPQSGFVYKNKAAAKMGMLQKWVYNLLALTILSGNEIMNIVQKIPKRKGY